MKHLQEGEKNYDFGCVADTLNNILLKSNAPKKIDLLSLDVEGSEMEVLKGINHKEYRFKYLCIETKEFKKLSDYLLQNDYIFLKKFNWKDYLFKDNTLTK